MSEFYCPICGNVLKEEFAIGDICPCCGNESECDDHIDKWHIIKQDEEHYFSVLKEVCELHENGKEVPKEKREYLDSMIYTKEEAWEILRKKWIDEGFKWKWNNKNEKPAGWNEEMAKCQLHNIGIYLT